MSWLSGNEANSPLRQHKVLASASGRYQRLVNQAESDSWVSHKHVTHNRVMQATDLLLDSNKTRISTSISLAMKLTLSSGLHLPTPLKMARLTHKQSSLFEDAPDHIARKQLSRKRYAALQNRKERERPISLHPLTDTVWLKIIGLLDAPSAVCFALTCHRGKLALHLQSLDRGDILTCRYSLQLRNMGSTRHAQTHLSTTAHRHDCLRPSTPSHRIRKSRTARTAHAPAVALDALPLPWCCKSYGYGRRE